MSYKQSVLELPIPSLSHPLNAPQSHDIIDFWNGIVSFWRTRTTPPLPRWSSTRNRSCHSKSRDMTSSPYTFVNKRKLSAADVQSFTGNLKINTLFNFFFWHNFDLQREYDNFNRQLGAKLSNVDRLNRYCSVQWHS